VGVGAGGGVKMGLLLSLKGSVVFTGAGVAAATGAAVGPGVATGAVVLTVGPGVVATGAVVGPGVLVVGALGAGVGF
jgi:hypothetical protein